MNFKSEGLWIGAIALAVIFTFSNSLAGEFVYDDRRQIVKNPLIQDSALFTTALTADVWAFKGDGTVSASNYWRPVFTSLCIFSFALFGLDPMGWHLVNILLHAGVCIAAYYLLRRWDISAYLATAIVLIFAVHPVHTESVAWISGSPDILFALFFLLSIIFADKWAANPVRKQRTRQLVISLLFYALALGSKEVALVCSPIFAIVLARKINGDDSFSFSNFWPAWRAAVPFFSIAVVYFFARMAVLGYTFRPAENSMGPAIFTVPSIFVFYLKQVALPLQLGPNYPLRPIESIGIFSVVLPATLSLAFIVASYFAARRSFVRTFGALLFYLALLPAFFITAFPSEQIVHDRYLYLPLLGLLIVVVTLVSDRLVARVSGNSEKYVLAVSVALTVCLGWLAFSYNSIWRTDIALWQHAVKIDDRSASNWLQLGAVLAEGTEIDAAFYAYGRSLEIRKDPLALMGRARGLITKGDLDGAVRDLEAALQQPADNLNAYTMFQLYEALALAFQQSTKLNDAERILREARPRLPIYHAALTEKLAVILYSQNRKAEALAELESARAQAKREMLGASKLVLLRLGMLYAEMGRKGESKVAFEEFLAATASAGDPTSLRDRRQAAELLKQVSTR